MKFTTKYVVVFTVFLRFCFLPGGIDPNPGLLQLEEVKWAALHVDETLRMSALSLLCTDARVTTVPARAETQLLQEVKQCGCMLFKWLLPTVYMNETD